MGVLFAILFLAVREIGFPVVTLVYLLPGRRRTRTYGTVPGTCRQPQPVLCSRSRCLAQWLTLRSGAHADMIGELREGTDVFAACFIIFTMFSFMALQVRSGSVGQLLLAGSIDELRCTS